MNDKKYPFANREYRLAHKKNILFNALIYTCIAVNWWVIYFTCRSNYLAIIAVAFTCIIPLKYFDFLKANNDIKSNIINSVVFVVLCTYFWNQYRIKLLIPFFEGEGCVLVIAAIFFCNNRIGHRK